MAAGRKRAPSRGPLFGGTDVGSAPGTYGLDWAIERTDAKAAADALIAEERKRPPATHPDSVQKVWEHLTGHALTPERARLFQRRREVSRLSALPPIRVWTGAQIAKADHPGGHLLLDDWYRSASRATEAQMHRARPDFVRLWPELSP